MFKGVKDFTAAIYYYFRSIQNLLSAFLFSDKIIDYKNIPIIINNRNRYSFLKRLVDSLNASGYRNIIILDNASTYEPLLQYYSVVNAKVIMLGKNLGYDALEKIPLYKQIKRNYFVYTDSDILPGESCPPNFLEYFLSVMKKYPLVQKVGFGLQIDDLPDHYDK